MLEIKSIFCHGTKNYFLLIDELESEIVEEGQRSIISKNISNFLETKSDGVLFVQKSTSAKAKMRMFNSDGTEAQMCGNGIRCVARYVSDKFCEDSFSIETKRGFVDIRKCQDLFSALINPVLLNPAILPFNVDKNEFIDSLDSRLDVSKFSALSVQNPHLVFIKNEIDMEELIKYGEIINSRFDIFPEQVNINFVKILDKNKIFVVTNERGSGITKSCGTGMSASSFISCLLGYCDFEVEVEVFNNGGLAKTISSLENKNIWLTGNAIFEKEVLYKFDNDLNICSFEVIKSGEIYN